MTEEEDEMICICPNAENFLPGIEGSVKIACSKCSADVWAAPTTINMIRDGAKPICGECGAKEIAKAGEVDVVITKEQIEEVARNLNEFTGKRRAH